MKSSIIRVITVCIFLAITSMWFLHFFSKSIPSPSHSEVLPLNSKEVPEGGRIMKTAVFAGGCFWCMEWIFEAQNGVHTAISGYIWWSPETANYEDVASGNTKHREAVKVLYNPEKISYDTLVELFWTQIDPTDPNGQFADKGYQYTTAIYYGSQTEKDIAEASKKALASSWKFEKDIVTQIIPMSEFFDAEEYHQDYYKKSALRYKLYKKWSGREGFIEQNWKARIAEINKQTYGKQALKDRLTPLQYNVTQEWWTERAFQNEYWDNEQVGIYVDIVDGTALYSSRDKYKSGTGWPSFTRPISPEAVTEHEDKKLFTTRTEIKSASSNSHLGHVFTDGPKDKGWLRYCMNSAALRFIPLEDLEKEGYGEYVEMFETKK